MPTLAPTLCLVGLLSMGGVAMGAATLHVSPSGKDTNAGTADAPLATLEAARDAIRAMKQAGGLPRYGVTVEVAPGAYALGAPFRLEAGDSGAPDAPITYRAQPGAEVRLSGGVTVAGFRLVDDPAILDRLEPQARGQVYQADLRALGVTDLGEIQGANRLELFFDDQPMTLARWPNADFVRIVDLVGGEPVDVRGTKGDMVPRFMYEGDRPKRWAGEKDVWMHGYWFWDWSDQRQKVESIDADARIISLVGPPHVYGYRVGQWYYALNLLCELDTPGEYYVDRETGLLYFWPPRPPDQGRTVVSVAGNLVEMKDVSHVRLRGFTVEAARGNGITVEGGTACGVLGCTLRNLGSWAVRVSGGTQHTVAGCDVYGVGDGGIALSGGDRLTLTPCGHVADNNHVHHYGRWNRMYQPAIALDGVGCSATSNLIHDAPHEAISFGGNDHRMERNEIYNVCTESNDAGAIYSGRDWTMRGTLIRNNYLHHITGFRGEGCVGVYLDDMFCGTEISGNVFYQVTRAAFIGGGRDNSVANNVFVDCSPALHIDDRAMNWASYHVGTTMKERLDAMPFAKPPWSDRYPELLTIWEDEPAAPKGNSVVRNICVGGRWDEVSEAIRGLVTFDGNMVDGDPGVVDAAKQDFRLREDSPAYAAGFEPIPFDRIGLYESPLRASWPPAR